MRGALRDPTCLRPTCRFDRLPYTTDTGGLGFHDFCSLSCAWWTEASLNVAQADFSPEVEQHSCRVYVLSMLLDLRSEPNEIEELGELRALARGTR